MSTLAIHGGTPVRSTPFPAYRPIGKEEAAAVQAVMESGILSNFIGASHPNFNGGEQVRSFEDEWAHAFSAKHAISVNSATSGLYAAAAAVGLGPGDEMIVSPYTMSASATAALVNNAVPVFADIEADMYCLSASTIEAKITPRTKAIMVVHIFGQSADMDPIMELARKHGLLVIEDCAQAPFAHYKGRPVGTLGDVGVFSLNYHKHIHTGEGGIVTTNNDDLAERVRLVRNHAEAAVEGMGTQNLINMIGFNYRMGEIEAAIGRAQLRKGANLVAGRQDNVRYLEKQLSGIDGLKMPKVREGCDHVYYGHTMDYDADVTGVKRETVVAALRAELQHSELRQQDGPLLSQGYVRPLYLQPIYQKQIGYGAKQCPFHCPHYDGTPDYALGSLPVVEEAHFKRVIIHELMHPNMSKGDLDDVAAAFHKVFDNLDALKDA